MLNFKSAELKELSYFLSQVFHSSKPVNTCAFVIISQKVFIMVDSSLERNANQLIKSATFKWMAPESILDRI